VPKVPLGCSIAARWRGDDRMPWAESGWR